MCLKAYQMPKHHSLVCNYDYVQLSQSYSYFIFHCCDHELNTVFMFQSKSPRMCFCLVQRSVLTDDVTLCLEPGATFLARWPCVVLLEALCIGTPTAPHSNEWEGCIFSCRANVCLNAALDVFSRSHSNLISNLILLSKNCFNEFHAVRCRNVKCGKNEHWNLISTQ